MRNWYGSGLRYNGIARDQSAIRPSLGSFARAIQFAIDSVGASCKRLDQSQTSTDAKRGKPIKEIEAPSRWLIAVALTTNGAESLGMSKSL